MIGALGFKKAPKGITRGVFAVDKTGKVLLAEPGGPAATVDAVAKLVEGAEGAAKVEADDEKTAEKPAEETKAINGEATEEKKADEESE